MLGISGTVLGAILRAYGKSKRERWQESYKDLVGVAAVWGLFVLVVSFLVLTLGETTIGILLAWLPLSLTAELVTNGFWMISIGSLLIGFSAFVSMFVGALVIDAAIAIKESV